MYHTTITVHFGEVDPAHIVYYPNIFHYCHIAFERFFAEYVGITYPNLLNEERLGFPTVSAKADFRQRIKYGVNIDMEITIDRIGSKSVDFRYRGCGKEGEIFFEIVITVVAVNMDGFHSQPIPAKYREIFAKCMSKGSTD